MKFAVSERVSRGHRIKTLARTTRAQDRGEIFRMQKVKVEQTVSNNVNGFSSIHLNPRLRLSRWRFMAMSSNVKLRIWTNALPSMIYAWYYWTPEWIAFQAESPQMSDGDDPAIGHQPMSDLHDPVKPTYPVLLVLSTLIRLTDGLCCFEMTPLSLASSDA